MKKLLVLLLVSALAIFVFAGCEGLVPDDGDGDGDGDGGVTEVTVEVEDSVTVGGKTYVSGGSHNISVTFPAPVTNVILYLTDCVGDYSSKSKDTYIYGETPIVLWPNADKTVWTGSATFTCEPCSEPCEGTSPCCASYILVEAGECEGNVCVYFPVIVDCDNPYAKIKIANVSNNTAACPCEGCAITFKSGSEGTCDVTECCGDDCSGLASWSIAIYDTMPFKNCCTIPCEEPIFTCDGTACPIDCTTSCLAVDTVEPYGLTKYWVIVNLVDKVGNEREYYATVEIDSQCGISIITEYCANLAATGGLGCDCTNFDVSAIVSVNPNDEYIGYCAVTYCCVTTAP